MRYSFVLASYCIASLSIAHVEHRDSSIQDLFSSETEEDSSWAILPRGTLPSTSILRISRRAKVPVESGTREGAENAGQTNTSRGSPRRSEGQVSTSSTNSQASGQHAASARGGTRGQDAAGRRGGRGAGSAMGGTPRHQTATSPGSRSGPSRVDGQGGVSRLARGTNSDNNRSSRSRGGAAHTIHSDNRPAGSGNRHARPTTDQTATQSARYSQGGSQHPGPIRPPHRNHIGVNPAGIAQTSGTSTPSQNTAPSGGSNGFRGHNGNQPHSSGINAVTRASVRGHGQVALISQDFDAGPMVRKGISTPDRPATMGMRAKEGAVGMGNVQSGNVVLRAGGTREATAHIRTGPGSEGRVEGIAPGNHVHAVVGQNSHASIRVMNQLSGGSAETVASVIGTGSARVTAHGHQKRELGPASLDH